MTAKEYLSQVYRIDQRVNSKLRQVDSLRDLATRATSTMGTEPVSGTRNVHRLADTIDKIVDLENEINNDIDHLVDLKRDVMATIGLNHAVAEIKGQQFRGFPAWFLWLVVHRRSILGVKNKTFILLNWVWNYLNYKQSLRLILKAK